MDEYLCIWLSVMQKLKNILGSRKKGAQEPHAAREPRYDYQGNTTSNLKGISLERLTLPVALTSYSLCPLFYRSSVAYSCPLMLNMCVCTLFVFFFVSVSVQRARSLPRMSPGVWETSPSIWTRRAIPRSCSSLTSR